MMRETDKKFFMRNIEEINTAIFHILSYSNIIPVTTFVLSAFGIFNVTILSSAKLILVTSILTLIDFLILRVKKNDVLTMYTGLFSTEIVIAYAGTNAFIGIYLGFAFVPFLASFYYDKKLTIQISVISYIAMLLSLYFKYCNHAEIFAGINVEERTFTSTYIPIALGFTFEFIFTILISYKNTTRMLNVITGFMNSVAEKTNLLKNIQDANKKVEFKNLEMEITQFNIIQFVAECLGSHDLFTGRHVLHTKEYVVLIAKHMQQTGKYIDILDDKTIAMYSSAAFLHDIGKLHIPEGILNKVGKFTDDEFELMKSHPEEGKKLLEFLPKISDGRFNEIAIQMAYCHHEKWNGSGYPRGISGEEIPLCARIMSAADVLDALISQRLYKDPMTVEEAMKVFENSKGTHFEPCIAEAVIECKKKIKKIDSAFKQQENAGYSEELAWWYRYHKIDRTENKNQ